MGEWLGGLLWWVFVFLAILQIALRVWCLIELQRKWRSLPELWGLDWLDVVYRVQRALGVPLTAADFVDLSDKARRALTAGQLWERIASHLGATGRPVPANGWDQVVGALSEALNVDHDRISPNSRLYADLGMRPGLD
jgi:hypothetical protein